MNEAARRRSGLHRAYVAAVFGLGLAALVDALRTLVREPAPYSWTLLAAFAVASQFWRIRLPVAVKAWMSASEVVLFLIVLWFGSAPAVVTIAVDGLFFAFSREWVKARKQHYLQAAFGLGEPVLSMWVASHVYFLLSGAGPLTTGTAPLSKVAFPAVAMGATYFLMNSGLNALVLSTSQGHSPFRHWLERYRNLAAIFLSSASIAVLVALSLASPSPGEIALAAVVLAPLIFAVYQFNKVETQRQHGLEKLKLQGERLAENLAVMAEESDEATSLGHIRSVKKYALWLAEEMGLTDQEALEALGFGALLHDLGKARIPDYIWAKPTRLTGPETRTMQSHAAAGARLAERIGFEFQRAVAPIIHRHHENWDGSGYPDGIAGENIPLGARIVQVADCYDALRRKRPYRRRIWTHQEAMAEVRGRAGTMYDPAVVRALEAIEHKLRDEPYGDAVMVPQEAAGPDVSALPAAQRTVAPIPAALKASGRNALTQCFTRLARLEPCAGIADTCEIVAGYLRRVTPASLVVFYWRDASSNDLVAIHASGYGADLVGGVRMPLATHVSGWVAVTGQSIVTEPSLDAVGALRSVEPGFKSLLSVPLARGDAPVGVVTLYATHDDAFQDEHRQALEFASAPMTEALGRAVESERSAGAAAPAGDAVGPASTADLEQFLAMDRRIGGAGGRARGVLCLRNAGEASVMLHAAMAVSESTRLADQSYRMADDALVVLMPGADPTAEALVLQRIAAALPADIVPPPSDLSPLRAAFAFGPRDGDSWSVLLNAAQRRAGAAPRPAASAESPAAVTAQRGLPWKG